MRRAVHAIRLHAFGPPSNLVYEEVEDPAPTTGQLRIAVAAAGVHLIDTRIRAGQRMGPMPLPELPQVPGREIAGVVDDVGESADASWLGRRAVAHLGPASGGYAELAVVGAGVVHAIPDGVDAATAVAMIGTGRTAMGILDVAAIGADDAVLVLAAAGGLGNLLVQAGLRAGARVVGAAGGAEKVARVRALGAKAVDYANEGWTDEVGAVTLVLDGVGGAIGRAAFDLLAPAGRFVFFGLASGSLTPFAAGDLIGRGLTAASALGRPADQRALEARALEAAEGGELVPLVTRFPLADAAAAHAAIEARETVGKVVVTASN